jgi:hypothetical protein
MSLLLAQSVGSLRRSNASVVGGIVLQKSKLAGS